MDAVSKNILGDILKDKSIASTSKDIVSTLGCLVRKVENTQSEDSIQHAPFSLLPSPFPRKCFEEALSIQQGIQLMLHKIAHDHDFLWDCLKSVVKVDDYTRKLWEIYDSVYKEGYQQPLCLAMVRSDYMLHVMQKGNLGTDVDQYVGLPPDIALKQVEMNTISSSMGGLAQQLHHYHRLITGKIFGAQYVEKIPVNTACECLAEGMVTAWKAYGNEKAVILFLVYEVERNIYDHRLLETSVMKLEPRVRLIRRSMPYLQKHLNSDDKRKLWVDGAEVAVIYQRCLYTPTDFVSEETWKCRLMMERSKAILCPNAGYHLAGTKKVQQVLSKPGVLERFVENIEMREKIRKTFMRMCSLEKDEEGDRAIDEAIRNYDKFVLKPQREGGGNNVYGQDVATKLSSIRKTEERLSYILMERINTMVVRNVPVKACSDAPLEPRSMVSELGVFGVLVGTKENIMVNKQGGYLLRTKKVGTDEGGVATGYSVLDSPFLVE